MNANFNAVADEVNSHEIAGSTINAYGPIANQFLTAFDANGNFSSAQPSFSNLSGILAVSQGGLGANFGASSGVLVGLSGAFSEVSGSTVGNLLVYNGTTWTNGTQAGSDQILNLGLSTSVGSSTMTVAINTADGNSVPSASAPAMVSFRNSSATIGGFNRRFITSSVSIIAPNGASFGTVSGQNQFIWVYALDNSGTVELALAGTRLFDQDSIASTTAISAGSTSKIVLYSTSARTNVAIKLIGRIKVNEVTAGTYLTAPSEVAIAPMSNTLQNYTFYRADTFNTYGSEGSSKIQRFTNVRKNLNTGVDFTVTDDSTTGNKIVINNDGVYAFNYYCASATATAITLVIALNPSAGNRTTSAFSLNGTIVLDRMNVVAPTSNENTARVSWTGVLSAGDEIRFITDGSTPNTAANCGFSASRVGE